jgi:hypothetical protein
MRWLLRLVLLRVLGTRVVLALAVLAWFRSMLQRGRAAPPRRRGAPGAAIAGDPGGDTPAGGAARPARSRGR